MNDAGPILVTGAGGFVGSEVALALHDAGTKVIAVDQAFDTATAARLADVRRVEGDLGAVLNGPAIGGLAGVIHAAFVTAPPGALGISRAAHMRTNIDMLTRTLDTARSSGARRFVFLSSMGVFTPQDAPAPGGRFTETTRATANCPYAAAKSAGEILTAAAAEPAFATLSLRLGNIFGPHEARRTTRQTLCLAARMVAEARDHGVITVHTPEAAREWSWLPDLARGIAALMVDGPMPAGVLHAGSPPVTTDLALARSVATRVPGTTVQLARAPHDPIRPPMGSDTDSLFQHIDWCTIDAALDQLIPSVAAPLPPAFAEGEPR